MDVAGQDATLAFEVPPFGYPSYVYSIVTRGYKCRMSDIRTRLAKFSMDCWLAHSREPYAYQAFCYAPAIAGVLGLN